MNSEGTEGTKGTKEAKEEDSEESEDAEEQTVTELFVFLMTVLLMLFEQLLSDDRTDCAADDEAGDDGFDDLPLFLFATAKGPHSGDSLHEFYLFVRL